MKNNLKLALIASALAMTPAAAFAQAIGATIYGSDGNAVGTVSEVNSQVVVIDTGKHKAPVPANLLYDVDSGKSVNATKDQIDAMMDERIAEADAKRDAALVQGASVVSVGGNPVGTLASVDLAADAIVLETGRGKLQLAKRNFAVNRQGELAVLYSRDQIARATSSGKAATSGGGTS
jgi:hypothetical protein